MACQCFRQHGRMAQAETGRRRDEGRNDGRNGRWIGKGGLKGRSALRGAEEEVGADVAHECLRGCACARVPVRAANVRAISI